MPYPRVTSRRSEPLYSRSSVLWPERREAGQGSPAVSQCNGTALAATSSISASRPPRYCRSYCLPAFDLLSRQSHQPPLCEDFARILVIILLGSTGYAAAGPLRSSGVFDLPRAGMRWPAPRSARRVWMACCPTCNARLKAPPLLPTKRRDDAQFERLKCCKGREPPVYSE